MKMQSSGLFLIILLLTILATTAPGNSMSDQFSYLLPPNLSLQVIDSHYDSNGRLQLSVILESALGKLSDLEIYFDSSKDLKVLTNLRTLKDLKTGGARKIRLLATRTGQQPDEIGSWVKIGVKYLPDYDAIIAVANNTKQYPDQFERQKLLEIVHKNSQEKARYSEAIRFFADQTGSKK